MWEWHDIIAENYLLWWWHYQAVLDPSHVFLLHCLQMRRKTSRWQLHIQSSSAVRLSTYKKYVVEVFWNFRRGCDFWSLTFSEKALFFSSSCFCRSPKFLGICDLKITYYLTKPSVRQSENMCVSIFYHCSGVYLQWHFSKQAIGWYIHIRHACRTPNIAAHLSLSKKVTWTNLMMYKNVKEVQLAAIFYICWKLYKFSSKDCVFLL